MIGTPRKLPAPLSSRAIVVKLPISFNEQFFKTGGFETFSHFQVWRQMPWEDKAQLLANFLRPTLNPVDDAGRHALVVGGYVLTEIGRAHV